jgi:hypothetical protein
MGQATQPERYPDTDFGVSDTPDEINRIVFLEMMRRSPEERFLIGISMLSATKELIAASLPQELSPHQRRRRIYERLYGEPLPAALVS